MRALLSAIVLVVVASLVTAAAPGVVFQASFDDTPTAAPGPTLQTINGVISYVDAPDGKAVVLKDGAYLSYPAAETLSKATGTLAMWLQPQWQGNDGKRHALFSDSAPTHNPAYNSFYLYKTSASTLQFSVAGRPEQSLNTNVADWVAGEWHHVSISWDASSGIAMFVDGFFAGAKTFTYEPQQWPEFNIGADYDGTITADAAFSEVQIFDRTLRPDQVASIAAREPLEAADIIAMEAPSKIRAGEECTLKLQGITATQLTRAHSLQVTLGGVPIASVDVQPATEAWQIGVPVDLEPVTFTVPRHLQLKSGVYNLTAILEGTMTSAKDPRATAPVRLYSPASDLPNEEFELRNESEVYMNGRPWMLKGPVSGFLHEGKFYTDDDAGRDMAVELFNSGSIRDALRCELVEEMEVVGGSATATYVLKNAPKLVGSAPVPHILVVTLDGDVDKAVGVEVLAVGEQQAKLQNHLLVWAALNPSDARAKGARDTFMFWPQTDACQVRFSMLGQSETQVTPPVRSVAIYRLLDYPSQNATVLPDRGKRRSLALYPQHTNLIYEGFGSDGIEQMSRHESLRQMADYMHFVGFDRLIVNAANDHQQAYYDDGALTNAWRWDLFKDLLPIADISEIDVVPMLPPLSNYDQFFAFTSPDSFLLDTSGELVKSPAGNRIPDPLRPEVRKRMLGFLGEVLDCVDEYGCVPAIGITADGASGTCFTSSDEVMADRVGYSPDDLRSFQIETGVVVEPGFDKPEDAYNWLRSNPQLWQSWLDFRSAHMHSFWTECRDRIVASNGKRYLLVNADLPVPASSADYSQRELLAHHGYDPLPYSGEEGLRISPVVGENVSGEITDLFATAAGRELQVNAHSLGAGREMLLPLLNAVRSDNPSCIAFRTSLDAKAGHESMLRSFARAFRALPAVPGEDALVEVWPDRDGDDIWVRQFDDCIAVINSTKRAQEVRITFNRTLRANSYVIDVVSGQRVKMMRGRGNVRLLLATRPYDLRTLKIVEPMPRTGREAMLID